MIKTEMIDNILTLIEEIEAVSDKNLVEILQEDYSDNWVAKEVIKLVNDY